MKKTTKKIFLGLGLSLLGTAVQAQDGLEKIIVEKYYIATKADSIGSKGILPVGSVTYRVYADMLPGYKFQALYGNVEHPLKINTTTSFFNNEDRGATTANAIASAQLKNNTVALDSWFSVGASAGGQFGVLKSEDNGTANLLTLNSLLKNNNSKIGIPLTTQDGNQAGTPEAVTLVGLTTELDVFDATSQSGNSFSTTNGAISALNGAAGPTAENRILLGQFTTDGVFSFEFNIQIGTPTPGVSQKYVVTNPINGEKTIPSLKFETNELPNVSITSPTNNSSFLTGAIANITASASDIDGTIAQVEFFVDGISVGIDNVAPYENSYPTTTGTHVLTAVAKDNKGDSTISEAINILVSDNIAPTVSVKVSPTAITGEMIPVNADAIDSDGTVASVEFFVDNVSIGKDNSMPFSINWNATLGTHTIKAVATDNKGLTGTSKDSIIIVKNNEAPTVTVSNPANAITGDFVTINATAQDIDGSISNVEFFVDNISIGSDAISPYSIQYKTTVGKHKIKAVAYDNLGLSGTSKEDSILVVNNQFPIVTINTPKNAISGDEVTFTASAEDKDGTIEQVEFLVDDVSIGIDAIAPYSIKWISTFGNHKVKAIATDNRGFKSTSADSSINVIDNIAPTIELNVDSTAKVDAQVTITATASDIDGTITKVEFYVDNILIATNSNAPYTTTWKAITGNHTVKVIATDNRGLTSTKTKNIMVKDNNAALENLAENIQTLVYPNPANKELSIIVSENAQISLTDVSGKTIIAPIEIYANTTHTMHIQNITAGVYLVKIQTPTGSKTERVIIQ
jgi:tetrahydromethanopterin S-methyltransferase subunit B